MQNTTHSIEKSKDVLLAEYSKRDAKWDSHRKETQALEEIYLTNKTYEPVAARMHHCSGLMRFKELADKGTGEINLKLQDAYFCHHRFCSVCSWRRSMKNAAKFRKQIPEIEAEFPTHRWLFLTLTVPNCETTELRETIKKMNEAWKRFVRKDWPAVGWIRSVEVTNEHKQHFKTKAWSGRKGYAHPHFHVLMMVPASYFHKTYMSQATWLKKWQEAMRDPSITSIDIRVIKPKEEGDSPLLSAAAEVLKYSTKTGDFIHDPQFLFDMTDQLFKMRFLATGGVFKGMLKNDMTDKEMIEGEDKDDIEKAELDAAPDVHFKWKREIKHYVKHSVVKLASGSEGCQPIRDREEKKERKERDEAEKAWR